MTDQIVSTLQQRLRERLIGPNDADYDTASTLYNGMIGKRPRLIARCVDVAEVIAAEPGGLLEDVGKRLLDDDSPVQPGRSLRHFMMDDEIQGRVQATYGENYERLASVKAKQDPENLFRVNQNILPAAT